MRNVVWIVVFVLVACSKSNLPNHVYPTRVVVELDSVVSLLAGTITKTFANRNTFDVKRISVYPNEFSSSYVVPFSFGGISNIDGYCLGWLDIVGRTDIMVIFLPIKCELYFAQIKNNAISEMALVSQYFYSTSTDFCHVYTKRRKDRYFVYARSMLIVDESDPFYSLSYKSSLSERISWYVKEQLHKLTDNKYDVIATFRIDDTGITVE